ncbi:MAG TPA: YciI-like protein [Vicinamibacterales bacterium]|nr:YciI-like protein [Vicinamibacterales bacterium]
MPYFALLYETIDDYVAQRAQFRSLHLERARESHARGELLLAGAFSDPVDGALLVFRAPDQATVEEFARHDPYVINGLIKKWQVRAWNVVLGNDPVGEPGPPPPAPAGR